MRFRLHASDGRYAALRGPLLSLSTGPAKLSLQVSTCNSVDEAARRVGYLSRDKRGSPRDPELVSHPWKKPRKKNHTTLIDVQ